jgi:hypothetical protein
MDNSKKRVASELAKQLHDEMTQHPERSMRENNARFAWEAMINGYAAVRRGGQFMKLPRWDDLNEVQRQRVINFVDAQASVFLENLREHGFDVPTMDEYASASVKPGNQS